MLKECDHTRAIKPNVEQGQDAQYPKQPTAEDRDWQSDGGNLTERGAPQPSEVPGPPETTKQPPAPSLSPTSQTLLESSERLVRQVATQHGLPRDKGLGNTTHAIAASARGQGMSDINLFRVADGQIRCGQLDGAMLGDGVLDARQAANQPMAESLERLGQVDQRQQQREGLANGRANPPPQNAEQRAYAPEPLARAM